MDGAGLGEIIRAKSLIRAAAEENVRSKLAAYNRNLGGQVHPKQARHTFRLGWKSNTTTGGQLSATVSQSIDGTRQKPKKEPVEYRKREFREDPPCTAAAPPPSFKLAGGVNLSRFTESVTGREGVVRV